MADDDLGPGFLVLALAGAACWLTVILLAVGSVVGLVWSIRREKVVQSRLRNLPD